jgi:hypothetical protein
VLIQTLRASIGLGVLLAVGGAVLWGKDMPVVKIATTVSVFDDAGVGLEMMEQAEEAAAYIFHRAGLEVQWLNCTVAGGATHLESCGKAVFPTNLQVRIARRSRNLGPSALGISYLSADGSGCYSEVFVEPVEELQKKEFLISTAPLLGQAMAHEIGHLLLGANAHSARGIMRARWLREDLVLANRGSLLFDGDESQKMREHLAEGIRRNAAGALVATRPGAGGAE